MADGPAHVVVVDWGTSRLRASLCETSAGGARIIDTRTGPGVLAARGSIEAALFEAVGDWTIDHGRFPLLLAGTIGSNIGWRTTPYLECPLDVTAIGSHCLEFESRGHAVAIVPGLECVNDLGNPDIMRGEELQVLGWLEEDPAHASGDWLVCLPGTHTKWVRVSDGRIVSFRTAMTGELYALLSRHSILLALGAEAGDEPPFDAEAFVAGATHGARQADAFVHVLFSVRSRALVADLAAESAPAYLSGLLIGADCATALSDETAGPSHVALVGEKQLCRRFSTVLDRLGTPHETLDGATASFGGFANVLRQRGMLRGADSAAR